MDKETKLQLENMDHICDPTPKYNKLTDIYISKDAITDLRNWFPSSKDTKTVFKNDGV